MSKDNVTIEDLARMVARGFSEVNEKMDKGFREVRQEMKGLREQNDKDHLDLRLRQDNVAHRFELQDLEERVTHLEKKAKFT